MRCWTRQFKNDAIGLDGNYGLTFTTTTDGIAATDSRWPCCTFRRISATSPQERTGVKRINYTREELALGLSWKFRPRWRTYAEVGIAYRHSQRRPGSLALAGEAWSSEAKDSVVRRPHGLVWGGGLLRDGGARLAAGHGPAGRPRHLDRRPLLSHLRPVERRSRAPSGSSTYVIRKRACQSA